MSRFQDYIDASGSFEKLKELDAHLEQQLRNLHRFGTPDSSGKYSGFKRRAGWLGLLVLLTILPFFVLIRTSVYLYGTFHLNGWLALAGGIAITVLLLMVYGMYLYQRLAEKPLKNNRYLVKVVSLAVLGYCCYGLLYLSGVNAKDPEVRSYYRSLHPILRITLTTTTLADPDLVITDTRRHPADYTAMGLPVNHQSLHYPQYSGYVHAVDIRTMGRPEWKNWLTRGLFWLAGLKSIRHTGTADHLHVYLPLQRRPA